MGRITILTIMGIFILWVSLAMLGIGIGVNSTDSAPLGIYLHIPLRWVGLPQSGASVHHKAWLGFIFPRSAWAIRRGYIQPHQLGLKAVGAFPGTYLWALNRRIDACTAPKHRHCHTLGTCQPWDSHHRPIPCQHWVDYRIPKGHYYLSSQRTTQSFDSRYFGLVTPSQMRYRLWLLWALSA